MAVYVDHMQAPYRGMIMCHMMADTTEELLAMADKIGVKRKWIQYPDSYMEHFDICLSKRAKAVVAGAKEIGWREAGNLLRDRLTKANESGKIVK
jgi:uncharacterized protein DUF4031